MIFPETESVLRKRGTTSRRQPPGLVRVVNSTGREKSVRHEKGTGFIVEWRGKRGVLTAAHLFRNGIGRIAVKTLHGDESICEIVARDLDQDIALLDFAGRAPGEILVPALFPAPPGTESTAWGLGKSGRPFSVTGKVVGYTAMYDSAGYEILKTTGKAREGDSGGPVLNQEGEWIGLLWGTDGKYSYSTGLERIKELLENVCV